MVTRIAGARPQVLQGPEFVGIDSVEAAPGHAVFRVGEASREHGLQPKRRRRYVATTDSDHDSPIFPDRARNLVVASPNQLWVADITYIAIHSALGYLSPVQFEDQHAR